MVSSLLSYLLFPVAVISVLYDTGSLDGDSQVKWFRHYSATYYFLWQLFLYYRTQVVLMVVVRLNGFVPTQLPTISCDIEQM